MPTISRRARIREALLSLKPRKRDYMGLRRAMMNFVLQEVAERHYKAFQKKKYGGRDEFRRRWAENAAYTKAKKGHGKIGYETGLMEASFTPGYTTPDGFYIKGHPLQVARATAYSVKFGTRVFAVRKGRRIPYARYFHNGIRPSARHNHRQPARPFWKQTDAARWVAAGVKKSLPHLRRMIRERA